MASRTSEKFWNVANLITLARIALTPVFALMLIRGRALGTLVVIFLAGLSDVLDGWVARRWNQRTKIGTLIDPLADKLLLSTAYVILAFPSIGFARVIPFWLTAAVLGRDFIILAGAALVMFLRGRREFPPTIAGKMSTVMQVATVFWVILSNYIRVSALGRSSFLAAITSSPVLDAFYFTTLLLTAVSGAHYVYKGFRMVFPGNEYKR